MGEQIHKAEEDEWKRTLTQEQYRVLSEEGTERPFTGEYESTKTVGVCAGAGGQR